jgi:predicted flap endonuclease-1-like 5' DNA nuclease
MRNPQPLYAPTDQFHSDQLHTDQLDDNLELINGIGPAFARALNQIGIVNFRDLTRFSPEELSKMLFEQAGTKVPAERIIADRWIEQAQALAKSSRTTEPCDASVANSAAKNAVERIAVPDQARRRQYAGFSLFFDEVFEQGDSQSRWQTRVYHDESGEEVQIPGIDTDSWVNWILDRAKLPVEAQALPKETKPTVSAGPWEGEGVQLEILDVHLEEVPTRLGDRGKTADTEVHFRLQGANVESLTALRAPYEIEIHMVDLAKGTSELVASERCHLRPGAVEYARRLRIPVSKVGRYELHTIVQLCPPYETTVYRTGPILNVVP